MPVLKNNEKNESVNERPEIIFVVQKTLSKYCAKSMTRFGEFGEFNSGLNCSANGKLCSFSLVIDTNSRSFGKRTHIQVD